MGWWYLEPRIMGLWDWLWILRMCVVGESWPVYSIYKVWIFLSPMVSPAIFRGEMVFVYIFLFLNDIFCTLESGLNIFYSHFYFAKLWKMSGLTHIYFQHVVGRHTRMNFRRKLWRPRDLSNILLWILEFEWTKIMFQIEEVLADLLVQCHWTNLKEMRSRM
jgi:hypothetical protein